MDAPSAPNADGSAPRRGLPLAARAAAALLILALGAFAVANAIGVALAGRVPTVALRYAPNNAAALAQAAFVRLSVNPDAADVRAASALARRSIAREPTNVLALDVIGLATAERAKAAPVFAAANALSRRSLPTQLWLIEDAVTRDDIVGALRQYDIALRTSRAAPSVLYPVLVEAVSDPALVAPIAATLSARPVWGWQYLQQLAQSGTSLDGATALFVTLLGKGMHPGDAAMSALYTRLVERGSHAQAWRLYAAGHPGARRTVLRNGDFALAPNAPAPFDWVIADNLSVSARIEPAQTGGRLVFASIASDGGEAANQLLLLAPGRHVVTVDTGEIVAPPESIPYFSFACAGRREELARQPLPVRSTPTRVRWAVTVPAGCEAQRLTLTLPPSSSPDAVSGAIRRVAID